MLGLAELCSCLSCRVFTRLLDLTQAQQWNRQHRHPQAGQDAETGGQADALDALKGIQSQGAKADHGGQGGDQDRVADGAEAFEQFFLV